MAAQGKQNVVDDLLVAITFCTGLPFGGLLRDGAHDLARASWAMPVAGAIVGAAGALGYWAAFRAGLAPMTAAALALLVTLVITGALHEDGLADTADSLGGTSREKKLAIMRDSRIGTFGVSALIISFVLRWSALVSIADPMRVALALVAAHVAARAALPPLMRFVPPARADGLSAQAGRPPLISVVVAITIAVATLGATLAPAAAVLSTLLVVLAAVLVSWFAIRQIGGQTGDVLGAAEQIGETFVLLTVAGLLQQASHA